MQTTVLEELSASDAQVILDRLPERIRMALLDDLRSVVDHRATEIEYPIERVVELAIVTVHGVA